MATDKRIGGVAAALPGAISSGAQHRLLNVIDFREDNESANEVVQMFNIPAGTIVDGMGYSVERLEGAQLTFDVGLNGETVDGFFNGVNGNDSSVTYGYSLLDIGSATPNIILDYTGGLLFQAAGVISLIPKDDADLAKIWLMVFCRSLNPEVK